MVYIRTELSSLNAGTCDRERIVSLLYHIFGDDEDEAIKNLRQHRRLVERQFGFDYLKDDKVCVCAHILEKLQHEGYYFNINKLSRWILSGKCPHVQTNTPRTSVDTTTTCLIIVAAALGKRKILQYFMKCGCLIDCSTGVLNLTPIHLTVYRKDLDLFRYLQSQGADVNSCCHGIEGDYSTLMLAVQENCQAIVKELLSLTDINGNYRNVNHKGALCCAVQNNSEDMVDLLLSANVKPTPLTLHKAIQMNNSSILEKILNVGIQDLEPLVNKAVKEGNVDMVKMLLERNRCFGTPQHDSNQTYLLALHIATINSDKDMVELLLQYTGNTQAKMFGYTALDWARILDYKNIENILKSDNTSLCGECDMNKFDPLCENCVKNRILDNHDMKSKLANAIFVLFYIGDIDTSEVIEKLASRGVDLNMCNNSGRTALNEAVYFGDLGALETLLRLGANPYCYSTVSPLMEAVMHGNYGAVKVLLAANAEMEVFVCNKPYDEETLIDSGQKWIEEPRNLPKKRSTLCEAVCKNLVFIAALLLKSGFNIRVESKSCLEWMISKTKSNALRNLLLDYLCTPRTLTVICRDSIRRCHRINIKQHVTNHCLPPRVLDIILLEDIL